jgi:protein-S-isoprenylcysteine O-methyltransferase Ste14
MAVLRWFLGSLVVIFVLSGVAALFWTVAHQRPSVREEAERVVGTSGYYSTEGGHDPIRRPGSTRDELKFRGLLTPPSEAPGR